MLHAPRGPSPATQEEHVVRSVVTGTVLGLAAGLAGCVSPPRATLTPGTWCDGFVAGRMSESARLSGANRERLAAAQRLVAPGLGDTRAVSGLSLLGGYQEELEKPRTDVTMAALYLATASGVPVTPALVGQVNGLLCVSTTARRAEEIAAAAARLQSDMTAGTR